MWLIENSVTLTFLDHPVIFHQATLQLSKECGHKKMLQVIDWPTGSKSYVSE